MTTQTTGRNPKTEPLPGSDRLLALGEAITHEWMDEFGPRLGCADVPAITADAVITATLLFEKHPEWRDQLLAEFRAREASGGATPEQTDAENEARYVQAGELMESWHAGTAKDAQDSAAPAEPDYFGESFTPRSAPPLPDVADLHKAKRAVRRLADLPREEREVGMMAALIAREAAAAVGYGPRDRAVVYGANLAQAGIVLGLALAGVEPVWTKRAMAASQAARMDFAKVIETSAQQLLSAARTELAGHNL